MIWCTGLSFPNTASNFAWSTLVRLRSFSLSCEKTSPKNDLRFGLSFPNTVSNFAWSTLVRLRSFSLFCEKTSPKNELRFRAEFPVKLRFLRLAVCIYSGGLEALSCEKNIAEKWAEVSGWVSRILRQISLGVPTVRRRSFSLSYEKILQKSRFWVFSEMLRQISLGVHSYAVAYFPTERPSV